MKIMQTIEKNQDINIVELIEPILIYKKYIFLVSTLLSFLFIVFLIYLPNKYESKSKFYPSNDPGSTSSSMKLLSGLSSLGGLSNFSLPTSEVAEYDVIIERIKSRDFLEILLEEDFVKANIYAAKNYDFKSKLVIYDDSLYNSASDTYFNDKGAVIPSPSIDDIYIKYLKMVSVSRSKETGIMELGFTHYSPFFASRMVDLILDRIDQVTRKTAIDELNKSIVYYESQLLDTKESDIRNSINALIKTNLEQLMLANVQDEYLINILTSSYVPKYKSEPKKSLLAVLGTAMIFVISIFFILVYHFLLRKDK